MGRGSFQPSKHTALGAEGRPARESGPGAPSVCAAPRRLATLAVAPWTARGPGGCLGSNCAVPTAQPVLSPPRPPLGVPVAPHTSPRALTAL